MKLIGVTGPIGSGKSSLRPVFEEFSIPVIDSDNLSREIFMPEIYDKSSLVMDALAAEFGDNIVNTDRTLNRKALAAAAFATPEKAARLGEITHPHILELMRLRVSKSDSNIVAVEAPLLFEAGLDKECAVVIAVVAPKEDRIRRVTARDGMTEEEALRRVKIQQDDEFYTSRAGYVIKNNGNLSEFLDRARDVIRGIVSML